MDVKRSENGTGPHAFPGRPPSPEEKTGATSAEVQMGWLERWYRWTTPPLPASNTSLRQREQARRARLASIILLIVSVPLLLSLPISLFNHAEFLPFLGAIGICCFDLFLVRQGYTSVVGVMLVIGGDFGFVVTILGAPHGLSGYLLPLFDLFAVTELVAVSLLPPVSVFVVAAAHCLFIWGAITYMPHTAEIQQMLAATGYSIYVRPIFLQLIIAGIAFLWVRSTTRALARADRAEEIVALQRAIAQQKEQLEVGIEQIVRMHVQIANGDFNTNIPLPRDNVLWRISTSLNNLRARLQRMSRTEQELQRSQEAIAHVTVALRQARARHNTIQIPRSNTSLDPLVQELNGRRLE